MASWEIRLTGSPNGNYVGRFVAENLTLEILNSEDGGFTCELPLSATQTTNPSLGIPPSQIPYGFGPKRSDWEIWRGNTLVSAGILTSVNLNGDRDTLLLAGRDWIWYLKQRIYPFDPEEYVAGGWDKWPKQWPESKADDPVDIAVVVRALIKSLTVDPDTGAWLQGARPISYNVPLMGITTKYQILPGDSTTIFDHIQKLSQMKDGFEFDILPSSLEFKTWHPRRDSSYGFPEFILKVVDPGGSELMDVVEGYGQIIELDWTNEGPEGTFLIGLGSSGKRVGYTRTDPETLDQFGRFDLVHDYGDVARPEMIQNLLDDEQNLFPQRKLGVTLLNPEFLGTNFYTGGRPRNLIGKRVRVFKDFLPYRQIAADFRINSMRWTIDQSTNEQVELGLEMLYGAEGI